MSHSLPKNLRSFIWHFLRPYKWVVIFYVTLSVCAGFWGPFNSMLIKYMLDSLASYDGDTFSLAWPAILIVLNFIVFDNFTWRTICYLLYKFEPDIKNSIIRETFRFVIHSSPQFFHDNLSGRIAGQVNALADEIQRMFHPIVPNLIRGTSLLLIAFVSAYHVDSKFFYILAIWFIFFAALSIALSRRIVHFADERANTHSAVAGQLVDQIGNVSNIGIFARRIYEISHLDRFLFASKNAFRALELWVLILNSVQGFLIAVMLGVTLYFLVDLYVHHLISIGDFALILWLSVDVGHMMWFTMESVDAIHQIVGTCKQSLDSLIIHQDIQDKRDAQDLVITEGRITFSNVKFHYKGVDPLFQNKSIIIEAGQKVGLVGYSGGGKSTFVNLILRMYDVTDGAILVDGQDIRDVKQDSLRSNIAMIPQDPSLFHRTLMENIRYGLIEASDDEVIEAAKKANAHEFIKKLPQGYESPVGERGVKLSGGQRQRVAIARAILKNAPILILDEATSQLDSVTESEIQESLLGLMQNKTTIVIAHRLSTLLHMDRILVFDQGKIVEDGSHAELLNQGGLYKILWDAQVGGFLPDQKIE